MHSGRVKIDASGRGMMKDPIWNEGGFYVKDWRDEAFSEEEKKDIMKNMVPAYCPICGDIMIDPLDKDYYNKNFSCYHCYMYFEYEITSGILNFKRGDKPTGDMMDSYRKWKESKMKMLGEEKYKIMTKQR